MRVVTFRRAWRMYQPGERAGFDAAVAEDLIKGGVAVDAAGAAKAGAEAKAKADADAKAGPKG